MNSQIVRRIAAQMADFCVAKQFQRQIRQRVKKFGQWGQKIRAMGPKIRATAPKNRIW